MSCKICKKLPWAKGAKPRCIHHGCNIDLGSSDHKQPGFLGTDKRDVPNIDLKFDLEVIPWKLPSNCCDRMLISHVLEHVKPWLMIDLMDEIWRVMKPSSQLYIIYPHAMSHGFMQDPTHCNPMNETTLTYFDPEHKSGLYGVYRPKPWRITRLHWASIANVEAVLEPRKEK